MEPSTHSTHASVAQVYAGIVVRLKTLIDHAQHRSCVSLGALEVYKAKLLKLMHLYEDVCSQRISDTERFKALVTFSVPSFPVPNDTKAYTFYPSDSLADSIMQQARKAKQDDRGDFDHGDAY